VDRVLIVEDDAAIGAALRASLAGTGHEVVWVRTGADALSTLARGDHQLALLDLGLPDMDGLEVCRGMRAARPACVIVILTARDEEVDVVLGLDAGADDYLTKPVRLAELTARVRAHLRRRDAGKLPSAVRRIGELEIDEPGRRVRLGGEEVVLRAKEFDLLARLGSDAGTAVSREDLMADVWDENWFGSTKTLDVHLSAVRKKLASAAAARGVACPEIVTLRGRGFRLEDPARGRAAR
jgi:DNA-binding response OmpR family regulator